MVSFLLSSYKPSFSCFTWFLLPCWLVIPHPPLHPPNNIFFSSPPVKHHYLPINHLSPKQKALFPTRAASCRTVLCMLINKAVGFFPHPRGLEHITSTRLGPGIPTTFLNLGLTVTDQFAERKKKVRKRLWQQIYWG